MRVGSEFSSRRERGGGAFLTWTVTRVLALSGLALVLALPTASGAATLNGSARSSRASSSPSLLLAGASLHDGSSLTSPNGVYSLDMQTDGNLVLYWEGKAIWASRTPHHPGDFAILQTDGNFVVYQGRRALWSSQSARGGKSAYYLRLQNDGNLVVYSPVKTEIWQTGTEVGVGLQYGDTGPRVRALQSQLVKLGYWLGTPDGTFGDSTQQAVWALQKAAGAPRDGVVGGKTAAALADGVVPKPRAASGNLIEVDLEDDLLMVIRGGKLAYTLNTSTGGGYTYTDQGVTSVAITPSGVFNIYAVIDGLDVDSLGALWRPRFFDSGFAIHGDSYVPPVPVSHGCVRVSNEAIDWIWANNIAPIGSEVWVY